MSRLKNSQDEYPWQSVDWFFGILYFVAAPFVFLLKDGVHLAMFGALLGFLFLIFLAVTGWWLEI